MLKYSSLVATFINTADTADTLTSLDIAEPENGIGTSVALAPNKAVSLGYNSDIAVTFTTTSEPLIAGHFVDVTFKFANNESIKLSLLVVANTGEYKDVTIPSTLMSVTPSPTPSAS